MKASKAPLVALFLSGVLAPAAALADGPHNSGWASGCTDCHASHTAAGSNLTSVAGNANLCLSCHSTVGLASRFDMSASGTSPVTVANLTANSGNSHAWGVPAANAAAGATAPTTPSLSSRLGTGADAGRIVCSTCHDQHQSAFVAPSDYTSSGAMWKTKAGAQVVGSGTVTFSNSSTTGATPKGYNLEIVASGAVGVATYHLSNDGGVTWTAAAPTAATLALDATTTASLSGTFSAAAQYRYYVSYAFLRVPLDSGNNSTGAKFCRDCHAAWVNDSAKVRTWTAGDPPKHHPVGVVLASTGGYRGRAGILDANGAAQGSAQGDASSANDLRLGADDTVQCFTCHGSHHAEGNNLVAWNP